MNGVKVETYGETYGLTHFFGETGEPTRTNTVSWHVSPARVASEVRRLFEYMHEPWFPEIGW